MSIIKKIFFFSVFLFALSLLFWLVYLFSFKKPTETTLEDPNVTIPINTPQETIPETKTRITAVLDEPILSPILSESGNIRYYSKSTGEAMEMNPYGKNNQKISQKNIYDLKNVFWSLDKSKVILKTQDPNGKYSNLFYDLGTNLTELSPNIYAVSWQTNADRIFYEYVDKTKNLRSLNVSDPDGKNWISLTQFPSGKLSFYQVPKTGLISFWNDGDAYTQTKLQSIPIVGGEVKTIFENAFGADYLWDFSGNNILVSQTDTKGGYKMQLAVMNYNGGEYRSLDIPTFVFKTVWSKDSSTVYYALPGGIPDKSVLPNEYKGEKFNTSDTFWMVDIKSGKKTRLLELNEIDSQYDAKNLFLNKDESILFFVNKIDEKLYRIDL